MKRGCLFVALQLAFASWALPLVAELSPSRMEYAASLMKERDYFRAVGAYKEAAFFELDPNLRLEARYHIGRAYRLAGRYELSLRGYASWLSSGGADSKTAGRAYAGMAADLVGMKTGPQAMHYLQLAEDRGEVALAELYRGLIAIELADFPLARAHLARVLAERPTLREAELAKRMSQASLRAEHAPSRSPFLAGALSTVVPGGGQVYTGHYVDAVQAFAFVGLLGWSSFVAYRYEASRDGGYPMTIATLSLTTIFHAANVVGAVRTADFFNRRQREIALEGITRDALRLDF